MRCELDTQDGGVCLGQTDGNHCTREESHFLHCPHCGATFGNNRKEWDDHIQNPDECAKFGVIRGDT